LAGAITRNYLDAILVAHGFLLARDGTFTTFDPPGSLSTNPAAINLVGTIVESYHDASFLEHDFLLSK
jgi:hypothetical protein